MKSKFSYIVIIIVAVLMGCQETRVNVPPFEVKVELDEKAKKDLQKRNETIKISVLISGIPLKDSGISENNKALGLVLGSAEKELYGEGVVRFDDLTIPKHLYNALENKHYVVSVNARSGWKSSKFNLLNCESLDKGISGVAGKQHTIKCKLIRDSE